MYTTGKAFTKAELKNITLNTRFVRSAFELFDSTPDAHVSDYEFTVYEELAKHPIGLIITAHTCVSPEGRSNDFQNAIWSDEYIPDQSRIASLIKEGAGKCKSALQIGHGGMKAENHNGGRRVLTPDNMTKEDVKSVREAFVSAAVRAKKCGFDSVELHGAHMYLLLQFFYPQYNHRSDEYGGKSENRIRIAAEILTSIKETVGDDFPVFIKLNGDNIEEPEQYFEDVVRACEILYDNGLEALELSGYHSSPRGEPKEPFFSENAARLVSLTKLPIIQVGGIRTLKQAEEILSRGITAVSMARPFICQPNLIEHWAKGERAKCISCGRCGGNRGRCIL